MADSKKLRVWQRAHALLLDVHRVVKGIRGAQHLSLRSQVIRAAMSIPANIVEGRAQKSERDFARFLGYAVASNRELEYELLAAHDIGVVDSADHDRLASQLEDVRQVLHGLIATLNAPAAAPAPAPKTPSPVRPWRSSGQRRSAVSAQRGVAVDARPGSRLTTDRRPISRTSS